MRQQLDAIYRAMAAHYGPTRWWPGETPFEIAVGAILTQNTAWTNVEKAIANLKRAHLLQPARMWQAPDDVLEQAVRPSGYFRQKSKRLKIFCHHLLQHYGGSIKRMAKRPMTTLRPELLALHGIGPETADDILLYACEKPVFVVDAYTKRILARHGLIDDAAGYDVVQALFHDHLSRDVALFKEYHGLIVYIGKDFCRRQPRCDACPLRVFLHRAGPG